MIIVDSKFRINSQLCIRLHHQRIKIKNFVRRPLPTSVWLRQKRFDDQVRDPEDERILKRDRIKYIIFAIQPPPREVYGGFYKET